MFRFNGWRWLTRQAGVARGARKGRRPRPRPTLEPLEDRTVPAVIQAGPTTLTWNGSVDMNWGDTGIGPSENLISNWTNSDGSNTGAIPQNGDDLVFPAGAANTVNTNNLVGLSVHSITFTGPGYGIGGNALSLTGALTDQQARPSNDGSADAVVSLTINLPNDVTVNGPAGNNVLGLNGMISGPGGMTVTGSGTVSLSGDNNYQGTTLVSGGVLQIVSSNALGSPAAGTTVSSGATLTLLNTGSVLNVPEPLALNGPGFQGGAALVSSFTESFFPNTWSGPITLEAESAVQTNAPLFINGLISGPGGLDVLGPAPLALAATGNNSYAGTTAVDGGVLQLQQSGIAVPGNLTIGTGGRGPGVCDVLRDEQIADGARVTIGNNSVLGINGNRETIGSLVGVGEVVLNNSPSGSGSDTSTMGGGNSSGPRAGTLVTGADNTSTIYAGIILGSGGNLVKVGGGVFVLTGANTYSGTTTVNGGTLRVDGSQPGSAVVVNGGGTLGGHGTVG
ncbi:MAG TPA: autotransporter-associated beta strand repeat-containing protein, partial [Gemmataceae bacterium]|nr:autotransporter-associated beta strand repeat-containing protein [Gemmataceae bacterium]